MIIEEYINFVENEPSPQAHITSFYGLKYHIKINLYELDKTYSLIVHSNDTLEMLRSHLAQHYKVSFHDIHLSIENSHLISNTIALSTNNSSSTTNNNHIVLNSYLNSKYLYQIHLTPGSIVYVKILGNTFHSIIRTESTRFYISNSFNMTNNHLIHSIPSQIMTENHQIYDILYQLSYLNNENIHYHLRNLLRLMPSDIRTVDLFDLISLHSTNQQILNNNIKQTIEYIFNFNEINLIKILYNLEILSCKLLPLSINIGIQQSSKLFRHDFIEQLGIEFFFKLLQKLNHLIYKNYEYILCQELILLILQLIQLLLCGKNLLNDNQLLRITSPIDICTIDNDIDFDFQAIIEYLQFEEFIEHIKQLIFLCWAAAAGNICLQEQVLTIKEQVKLDRYALLKQINENVFCRNNSQNSISTDSIQFDTVQYGCCVKNDSILPLDSEIAEKIIDIVMFCFEKRPEFIGKFLY